MNDTMKMPQLFGIFASIALILLVVFNIIGSPQANGLKVGLDTAFNITASALTVILLIAGSRGLALKKPWADEVYLVAIGMLIAALMNLCGKAASSDRAVLLVVVLLVLMLTFFNLIVFAAFHRPLFEEVIKKDRNAG